MICQNFTSIMCDNYDLEHTKLLRKNTVIKNARYGMNFNYAGKWFSKFTICCISY